MHYVFYTRIAFLVWLLLMHKKWCRILWDHFPHGNKYISYDQAFRMFLWLHPNYIIKRLCSQYNQDMVCWCSIAICFRQNTGGCSENCIAAAVRDVRIAKIVPWVRHWKRSWFHLLIGWNLGRFCVLGCVDANTVFPVCIYRFQNGWDCKGTAGSVTSGFPIGVKAPCWHTILLCKV